MGKYIYESNYLMHHGIKGQKWGVENGPPYPLNPSKDYSTAEKKANKIVSKVVNKYNSKSIGSNIYNATRGYDTIKAQYKEKGKVGWGSGAALGVNYKAYKDMDTQIEKSRKSLNKLKSKYSNDKDIIKNIDSISKEIDSIVKQMDKTRPNDKIIQLGKKYYKSGFTSQYLFGLPGRLIDESLSTSEINELLNRGEIKL